jgi:hypothetical protein
LFSTGQISQKDGFWRSVISKQNKLSATIDATGTYFDGDALKNAWVVENTDVSKNFNGSWGVANKNLLLGIPADTVDVNLNLKVADYKDDRIQQLLGTIQKSQPTLGVGVEPYLTYATVVDNFIDAAFDASKTTFPFQITLGIEDASVSSSEGMYAHYIIMIAGNSDNDAWLQGLDPAKLTIAGGGAAPSYNGTPITDHSYAVLEVTPAESPNIAQEVFNSNAPWAVLAKNSFFTPPPLHLKTKDDVAGADAAQSQNLGTCADLLKKELRFSAVDRAVAISAFAAQATRNISSACKAAGIADADCHTTNISAIASNIDEVFGISHAIAKVRFQEGSNATMVELMQLFKLN